VIINDLLCRFLWYLVPFSYLVDNLWRFPAFASLISSQRQLHFVVGVLFRRVLVFLLWTLVIIYHMLAQSTSQRILEWCWNVSSHIWELLGTRLWHRWRWEQIGKWTSCGKDNQSGLSKIGWRTYWRLRRCTESDTSRNRWNLNCWVWLLDRVYRYIDEVYKSWIRPTGWPKEVMHQH